MKSQSYRRLVLVQKYDCKCFYRTSHTNKRAKSSSSKRLRVEARKEITEMIMGR